VSARAVEAAGCFTALATPFLRDAVDLPSLRRLVRLQVEAGVAGLCPCGTTGESPTVSPDEHRAVVETTVAEAGAVPVVAGAGSNDTRRAVELVRSARRAGAAAALAVAPYYSRPSQEGLYRHFRAMADDGGLPLMLYHIPSRTGVSIDVETIARLWRAGGIVALKEAHGSVDRVTRLRDACGVPILSGDDGLTLPMIALGAVGVVSVASNVAPREVVALVEHALAGRHEEALATHERLAPLVAALFAETNPVPVKAALRLLGVFESEEVRLPLVAAGEATVRGLRAVLASFGTPTPAA
jgi:4-hydroxy-tetrahydrodipicolinate synthase